MSEPLNSTEEAIGERMVDLIMAAGFAPFDLSEPQRKTIERAEDALRLGCLVICRRHGRKLDFETRAPS